MGTGNLLGAVQQPDDDYCSGRWGEISGRSNVDYAYQLIVQVVEEGADRNAHLRWPSLSEKVEDPALLLTPIGAPEGDRPRQRFRPKILIWVTAQARGLDEVVSEDAETDVNSGRAVPSLADPEFARTHLASQQQQCLFIRNKCTPSCAHAAT
jgi:hypothetical protein